MPLDDINRAYLSGLIDGWIDAEQRRLDLVNFEIEINCPDGAVDEVCYSEFEIWRETHKAHKDPGGDTLRCPRCFSTKIRNDNTYIKCLSCRYSLLLWD